MKDVSSAKICGFDWSRDCRDRRRYRENRTWFYHCPNVSWETNNCCKNKASFLWKTQSRLLVANPAASFEICFSALFVMQILEKNCQRHWKEYTHIQSFHWCLFLVSTRKFAEHEPMKVFKCKFHLLYFKVVLLKYC